MLWLTYTVLSVFFFFALLISAKATKRALKVPALLVSAVGCALVVFVLLYIPLQVSARKVVWSEMVKLSPLSRPHKAVVYVIAVAVSNDGDTKKDAYIVNLDSEGFPSQGIFTEGEVRLSFEQRDGGVIEKRTINIVGKALWFTADQPRVEYIIRVPIGSMERPARVKEFW
ncbi:MAG TPA: hypothetical protein VJ579_01465 [Candidatus Paceibacterota bacterium]|nr:hypothetical protein [Candidatus Paceibacterota bacterium]